MAVVEARHKEKLLLMGQMELFMATLNICNRQMHDGISVAHRCYCAIVQNFSALKGKNPQQECGQILP